ncbi:MAG: phage tail tube protein, partial [Phyllobacterium sp.]
MNYIPGSPTDRFLNSIKGKRLIARLTFPNGVQIIFMASRQTYEKDVPNDDKMTATLTLKVSGEPIMTDAAAPRNLELPTITGTAKVGIPLTVDGGIWIGALNVTYQWKLDDADIVDATGQAYVPVAGDVGDTITVEVTGSNSAFDTSVESVATTAVMA